MLIFLVGDDGLSVGVIPLASLRSCVEQKLHQHVSCWRRRSGVVDCSAFLSGVTERFHGGLPAKEPQGSWKVHALKCLHRLVCCWHLRLVQMVSLAGLGVSL